MGNPGQRLCVRVQEELSISTPCPPPLPPPPPPSPPPPSSTPRLPGHSIATEHGGCADAATQRPGAAAAATGGDLARGEAEILPASAGRRGCTRAGAGGTRRCDGGRTWPALGCTLGK
ncbi:homeobox protein Hox-B4-like [Lutra lutra]|uniref:homeobox protein Hox-B4-like n=1 Tax=Lutra lutra TaxID=9657 RepID=UPI001FD0163D|nr:homeobox protein Hox-B4-like [Lutra lutra]